MIVIVYRTNYIILAKNTYQRLEIIGVGFCYLVRRQYDNNDLGGIKKTGAIKNEMIRYVRIKNPLPAKIDFVETWHLSKMNPAITEGENSHFLDNKMKIGNTAKFSS